MPGKYSRQLAKTCLIDVINDQLPQSKIKNTNSHSASYDAVFEKNPEIIKKLRSETFPRPGGNRNISDIDLRSWENLYMTSLKILKKSDLYKDVADNMQRQELYIENYWQKKESKRLVEILSKVIQTNNPPLNAYSYTLSSNSQQKVRYHVYYSYAMSESIGEQRIN